MRPGHCQGTGGQAYKEQPRERCDQERWNRVGNQNGTTHLVRQLWKGVQEGRGSSVSSPRECGMHTAESRGNR